MNLCRCERGHFYDKEKYATCPHCAGGSGSDDERTEAFTDDVTIPVKESVAAPQFIPDNQPGGMAIASLSASDETVALDENSGGTPTVPLWDTSDDFKTQQLDVGSFDDDNDHTIGYFDDDFFKSDKTSAAASPTVNKVSTPCVGWLIALSGEHIGTDFRLKVGKNFIGRNLKNDIALTEDKSVSRDRHAIVVYEPKMHMYLVQPGESSSLVYMNNEVVLMPVKLQAYDMITVGEVDLLFIPLCGERFNWGDLFTKMKKNA